MKLNEDQHSAEVMSREDHTSFKSQEQNVQQKLRNKFTFVSQIQNYQQQLHLIQNFLLLALLSTEECSFILL